MNILVTGAAGFIGYHLCSRLLADKNHDVFGIDNMNDYYPVALKEARVRILNSFSNFSFKKIDISNNNELKGYCDSINPLIIVHLAAQAGVRFSIKSPKHYVESNLVGHSNILDIAQRLNIEHLIYASSSSVYGESSATPYNELELSLNPESFYAATKISCEVLSQSYSNLYQIPITGLRFFTVYGPWGRPDMAYYSFTEKIIKGEKIQVFGNGESLRDFTYVDDVVDGIIGLLNNPPLGSSKHELFNIGKSNPVTVNYMISILEGLLGKKAKLIFTDKQMGDVSQTYADISKINKKIGYEPQTELKEGLNKFTEWHKKYTNS